MDPRRNSYAPGAGSPPPELAGRDGVFESAAINLDRVANGLHGKDVLFVGLRGVGKTVLLDRVAEDAEARGFVCLRLEAPEDRSLPALLAPALHRALLRLDRIEATRERLHRAWRGLAGFVAAVRLRHQDVELRIDAKPEPGLADTDDLEADLADLFHVVGEAARERGQTVALFVDELQYIGD